MITGRVMVGSRASIDGAPIAAAGVHSASDGSRVERTGAWLATRKAEDHERRVPRRAGHRDDCAPRGDATGGTASAQLTVRGQPNAHEADSEQTNTVSRHFSYHRSEGLSEARSCEARTPSGDERQETESPLERPPPLDDH